MCEPCVDNCYDLTQGCRDACDPEDWACERICETDTNHCLLNQCIIPGLCCDEFVCVPPMTCGECKAHVEEGRQDCLAGCNAPGGTECRDQCEFQASLDNFGCFLDGRCCEDTCATPGGCKRSMQAKYSRQAGLNQTYRRQARSASPQFGRAVVNSRQNGRPLLNAPLGRQALNALVSENKDKFNPMYQRQLQSPFMGRGRW